MKLERIPVAELPAYAERANEDSRRFPFVPIIAQRALSQVANPAARPNDVGLIVAYDQEGVILGYLGLLPCRFSAVGKIHSVAALTTFYVDPNPRGRGVAKHIMADAVELGLDFLLAGYSASAERFYLRHPEWFVAAPGAPYFVLHVNPARGACRAAMKKRGLRSVGRVATRLDDIVRDWNASPLDGLLLRIARGLRSRDVEVDDVSSLEFDVRPYDLHTRQFRAHFSRDLDVVNWAVRHPWVIEGSVQESRYYFSSARSVHRIRPLALRRGSRNVGYCVLVVTEHDGITSVKIVDFCVAYAMQVADVLALAMEEAVRARAERIEGSDAFRSVLRMHPVLRGLTSWRMRGNFLHFGAADSPLAQNWKRMRFDYPDGDRGFA